MTLIPDEVTGAKTGKIILTAVAHGGFQDHADFWVFENPDPARLSQMNNAAGCLPAVRELVGAGEGRSGGAPVRVFALSS